MQVEKPQGQKADLALHPKTGDRLAGFDAILGNPPFAIAKDELARRAYMKRWTTAIKGFHLLVPFFERQSNEHIARIEQPVYKRRWVPPDYEKVFAEAFKWWLREKAEFYLEHAVQGGPVSLEEWASALWKDPRVRAAAEVYHGGGLLNAGHFEHILKEAVEEETVPDDETAFKSRHKQLRGKLNVPRERFRSLTAKPGYYVWAGVAGIQ